jgi:Tol biopolymer transport system component
MLADGTTARVWDSLTGQTQLITPPGGYGPDTVALANPGYHSWAPDSSALAITLGGYRSAQANKWLALVRPNTGASTVAITNTEQIPGLVAWSPKGDLIAYAAVPAEDVTPETVDDSTLDSPAVAGRRIYLYEAQSGEHYRLEETEAFQDAPLWSRNGTMLYYVQQEGDQVVLMVADFYGGVFAKIPGASMPVAEAQSYYGQFDWQPLLSKATR